MLAKLQSCCDSSVKLFHRIEDGLLVLILIAMLLFAVAQIVMRNLFDEGFVWIDPMLRTFVLWLSMLGALVATRSNKHIAIDLISRLLPHKANIVVATFGYLFAAAVSAVVAYHACRFLIFDYEEQVKTFLSMPAWIADLIIPFTFAVIALRYLAMAVNKLFEFNTAPAP